MAPQRHPEITGPEAFRALFGVSRETVEKLETYAALLKRWQKTINLVAPSTLNAVWHRHFADSAQVWVAGKKTPSPSWGGLGRGDSVTVMSGIPPLPASPTRGEEVRGDPNPSHQGEGEVVHWLDLGSGAGFPGLVIAILAAETGGTRHTLVESDSRKAAFLREVARIVAVPVDIVCARIENAETCATVKCVDRVTARALAPLPRLLELVIPYFASGTVGLFAKGREVASELEEASMRFQFDYELKPSLTDDSGQIVIVSHLLPKVA